MWIAESQPELSWLMFVSAVEVAAGQWRSAKDSDLERMQASRPDMVALLTPYGDDLVQRVAKEIADYMGSTKAFTEFLINFVPAPPERRPDYNQHSWEVPELTKTFKLIYKYRSLALHGGTPFPFPMCSQVHLLADGVYPEKPRGLGSQAKGAVWDAKDTPMLLHLFEYIVRKSLLKWWQRMADESLASIN